MSVRNNRLQTGYSHPSRHRTISFVAVILPLLLLLLLLSFSVSNVNAQIIAFHKRKKPDSSSLSSPPLPTSEEDGYSDEVSDNMTLAGQILPVLSKFIINEEKARKIFQALSEAIDIKEFFILGFVGWGTVPIARAIYIVRNKLLKQEDDGDDEDIVTKVNVNDGKKNKKAEKTTTTTTTGGSSSSNSSTVFARVLNNVQEKLGVREKPSGSTKGGEAKQTQLFGIDPTEVEFRNTYLYHAVRHISQAAQIGALVYIVDCLAVILNTLGFKYSQQAGFSKKAAKLSYGVWVALRLSALKRYLLRRAFKKKPDGLGRTRLYDRLLNLVLSVVTGGWILDMFDIDFGLALKSLLTFGGVGTLVLSLASKDLASELVSGLALSTSDRFLEGDSIELGDGTAGVITHMGLAYTDIRGYDEVSARIPNSQLSQQRVRNWSRVNKSQVQQTLWFSYKDIALMSTITEAIKEEIRASCPDLITDGSRPFRAHWSAFKQDHLEVVVVCHFNIKAATNEYWENRQRVLEAIARAVDKLGVKFTLPAQICRDLD